MVMEKNESTKATHILTRAGIVMIVVIFTLLLAWLIACCMPNGDKLAYTRSLPEIIALGTMLFTALYAFAFISLQGAINKNTEAQNGKNERKDKNNVLLVLSIATSNLLQQSIEKVDSLDLNKKISDNDYHSLVSWNHKISVYLTSIDKHKEYIAEENRNYVAEMLSVNQKIRDSIEFIHAHNLTDNYQKGLHVSLIQMGNMLNYLETQIFVNNIEIN